ncbi:hypothetical protein GCM10022281_09290 [Sphingomonas rosea]|uniref:Uncharacterized protein n=1 Tax=Sphingomonas rosea TaxID=335605 RepID=A0ABP7TVA1_9SPHN
MRLKLLVLPPDLASFGTPERRFGIGREEPFLERFAALLCYGATRDTDFKELALQWRKLHAKLFDRSDELLFKVVQI